MNLPPAKFGTAFLAVAFALTLIAASVSYAQLMQPPGGPSNMQNLQASQDQISVLQDVETHSPIDPKQTDAYKKFFEVAPQDTDKKIKLGNAFLSHYPKSPYTEAVEVGLTNAYLAKQDFTDFFSSANRALALNPNEVDVLTSVGWVIPHVYDPKASDAAQQLDEAESYEKRAIGLLDKMKKSDGVSDADFARSKNQSLQQAHSALGLIYFRRGDYTNSASELQQSTQAAANPDQTDLYVLGVDLHNLNRHADAAKVFAQCGRISGALQDGCKKNADQEQHLSAAQ